jgi:hypothetical protein
MTCIAGIDFKRIDRDDNGLISAREFAAARR